MPAWRLARRWRASPTAAAWSHSPGCRADDTARWLVDARLRAFLDEDRARGGVLIATVRAFADANLNLRLAAGRLQVHPNTAQYRLRRIEERTGRNPRRIADLLDLLVAIELDAGTEHRAAR